VNRAFFDTTCVAVAAAACISILAATAVRAQEAATTVADQVYTDAQAVRGAGIYGASCAGCHRADLGGNTGPALKEQRFTREFAGKDLKALFTRIATTMPRNAPATLGDNAYLDVVAYMLKENGFPAGVQELTIEALDGIRVLAGRPKPAPPVGDFSYVELVGCLAVDASAGGNGSVRWMLTRGSDPVAPPAVPSAPPGLGKTLGTRTVYLVDAIAYAPDSHRGQKVYVRGLLINLPGEQRMTISTLEMVSPTCTD
jgi:mono/diheme cytochrome c family protein